MGTNQRFVPVIGTAHTDSDEEGNPRFALTSKGREVLDEDCAVEQGIPTRELGNFDTDDTEALDAARQAAVFGNFDTVAEQQATIRELRTRLEGYERANEAIRAQNTKLVAAHGDLLHENLGLQGRLERLLSDGMPAPVSLDEAITQLFDAEAVFAGAERTALAARGQKFDAQCTRDRAEAAAIVRLVGTGGKRGEVPVPGAMSPTEAKDRLEEDSEYAQLAGAYRNAARLADERDTDLRLATSRVETLRACVDAMAKRSPLTARAAAIATPMRIQQ